LNTYYRNVRIHQEKVNNCEIKEDGQRIKWGRSSRNLPYLEWYGRAKHTSQKSWKKLRKTQYHVANLKIEKNCHNIFVKDYFVKCQLIEYFQINKIPHKIIQKGTRYRHWWWQWYKWGIVNSYNTQIIIGDKIIKRTVCVWRRIKLDQPIKHCRWCSNIEGWNITWWHEKDIGIDMLINKFSRNRY